MRVITTCREQVAETAGPRRAATTPASTPAANTGPPLSFPQIPRG
jgi:hypothetical protein